MSKELGRLDQEKEAIMGQTRYKEIMESNTETDKAQEMEEELY